MAHSKRVLFRATLQYCMVLGSVTLALSSTISAFVLKKSKGLFAFLPQDCTSLLSHLWYPYRAVDDFLVTWRSLWQTC